MPPKVPKIAKSLVGYCEMIYDYQTNHHQCHKWWSTLVKMVRERCYAVRTVHVVRNWTPILNDDSLKTTTFAAVRHLDSILRNGSLYERAGCLARYYTKDERSHCIALLLEEVGTHLRLLTYDPNGSRSTTNPFRDPAVVEGVEASLARRLGRRVEIVPMVRDAVGVQQRTPFKTYGLCTLFAAYGLSRFLKDPTWSDTRWDVPELTTWCMYFADLMGMDYWKAPDVARQRLQSPPSLFECRFIMNFVNGDDVMVSLHRCKSAAAARLWEARINETRLFKNGAHGAKSCIVSIKLANR
jgi:hypothetical protein